MIKVLITTNIPSPYFVDYANELSKYVELTVIFELKVASDRNKDWQRDQSTFKFKYIFLNVKKYNNESGFSFKIKKYLKDKSFNKIIIANPTTPTGVIALLYLRKHHIPFIIQSEGGFRGNGRGIKEKFKKYLMEKAEFYLTGMGTDNDYFLQYGAIKEKLKKYNFTSLHQADIAIKPLSNIEKKNLRKYLNLNFKHMILYVGQFIDRKNIPSLLRAYKEIQNKDICLVLIGGKPTKEYKMLEFKLNLINVYYYPFKDSDEVLKYYKAADVFVLPTKEDTWGLVINEAMAQGLPVVSSDKSIAASILIKNNINGFVYSSNDETMLSSYIDKILNNNDLSRKMAINNIKKIKDYTIEKMAKTIYNYLNNLG